MTNARTLTSNPRPTFALRQAFALALIFAVLALPVALAAAPVGVDASAVPFADLDAADAYLVGVELATDGGQLVVVFSPEGQGTLGNAVVPVVDPGGYPVNALGDVVVAEALMRSELIVARPRGFTFIQDGGDVFGTAAAYAHELAGLGFDVAFDRGGRIVDFSYAGSPYRATFGFVDGGVRVYLGAL